jgi:hypothetical protein
MPSYRVVLTVGALAPGVQPPDVLPAAADAARELVTVEAYDVGVVSGEARITVRFTADDDATAWRVHDHVRSTTGVLADLPTARLTQRYGPRWHPVRGR